MFIISYCNVHVNVYQRVHPAWSPPSYKLVGFDNPLIVELVAVGIVVLHKSYKNCSYGQHNWTTRVSNVHHVSGMPYFYVELGPLDWFWLDLWVSHRRFDDVLRVWTHGTPLEIGSLAVHVGLHEVYRPSHVRHRSFDLEMWSLLLEIHVRLHPCLEMSWGNPWEKIASWPLAGLGVTVWLRGGPRILWCSSHSMIIHPNWPGY